MEEVKWTERERIQQDGHTLNRPAKDMPRYDVTFPYIRGMVGPVDYTPGGMRNATEADFQPVYNNPMTMGTRCHQLACYVIHESQLTMMADNPTAYMNEPDFTSFLTSLPTTYDEMRCIGGKLGEYIAIARRKGDTWYVGIQTNWSARDVTLNLSFLPQGTYEATIYSDGINADKDASDYKVDRLSMNVTPSFRPTVHLCSGGGWVGRIEKLKD
jgi:alpha-glucosidase